jgi:hypothetical protein
MWASYYLTSSLNPETLSEDEVPYLLPIEGFERSPVVVNQEAGTGSDG